MDDHDIRFHAPGKWLVYLDGLRCGMIEGGFRRYFASAGKVSCGYHKTKQAAAKRIIEAAQKLRREQA